ncbi:MAG: cob(I)yrinic acid a,c-diamide adenosyltransferase [Oscillospiraceae bacterium]
MNTNAQKSMVHLYVGDGKGKTTAAIGLAVRCTGNGGKVLLLQFLKGNDSSELAPLKQLGVEIIRTEAVKKFTFQMSEQEKETCSLDCSACFEEAAKALISGEYDLIVLDEVVDAVNAHMLTKEELVKYVTERNEKTEVVMTGRNPAEEIVEIADYVTLMTAQKHPYQKGIFARKGIEY